jgi:hypothetical protein
VSEGTYYDNPYYASVAVQAARAGLFVMPYVFADPFDAKDSKGRSAWHRGLSY